jgi:hypothetical protein
MSFNDEVVEHVQHGTQLYSLMVLPMNGEWLWVLIRTDMRPDIDAHVGTRVAQGRARQQEQAWRDVQTAMAQATGKDVC